MGDYLTLVSLLVSVFGWSNWRYKIFVKSGQNWVWDILVSEYYPREDILNVIGLGDSLV